MLARVLEKERLVDVRWAVTVYGFAGIEDFFRSSEKWLAIKAWFELHAAATLAERVRS